MYFHQKPAPKNLYNEVIEKIHTTKPKLKLYDYGEKLTSIEGIASLISQKKFVETKFEISQEKLKNFLLLIREETSAEHRENTFETTGMTPIRFFDYKYKHFIAILQNKFYDDTTKKIKTEYFLANSLNECGNEEAKQKLSQPENDNNIKATINKIKKSHDNIENKSTDETLNRASSLLQYERNKDTINAYLKNKPKEKAQFEKNIREIQDKVLKS